MGKHEAPDIALEVYDQLAVIRPVGSWRTVHLESLELLISKISLPGRCPVRIDAKDLTDIDTAGALLLHSAVSERAPSELEVVNALSHHQKLIDLVMGYQLTPKPEQKPSRLKAIKILGQISEELFAKVIQTISFLGRTISEILSLAAAPHRLRLRELCVQFELAFLHAIPVVALVTFLIGVVIAYLVADQIQKYGGNIFIVDGIALAIGRELSPLIVATVVAGRSGSAFTAQIGSMKLTQEIDAIEVMGLRVFDVVVLPRVIALVLAMPLLVLIGDIVGLFGGMLIADGLLDITPATFLERLHSSVKLKHFISGIIKAPVFALFIALIGCRMGLAAQGNARSVGLSTTSTVVQSIVAVILLDALFAVIYMELGY